MERTQKHCSRLWNGMVIRHDGNVFPCCNVGHAERFRLGNIYQDSTEDIINGPRVKELRQLSIESKLPCYENCDQVKLFEAYPVPLPSVTESRIADYRDLQIEYGELCNVDCIMCWQDRTNETVLKYEVLRQKLPLDNWGTINAYGGEVFVMPDAYKHVLDILSMGKKNLTITTNGMTLGSPKVKELLVQNAHEIIVSINAAHEAYHTHVMKPQAPFFNLVLQNIASIQKLKIEKNSQLRITGHFTALIETLFEIPHYLKNFRSMGFDTAVVNFDHRHFPNFFATNPQTTSRLKELIDRALENHADRDKITICMMEHIK